MNQRTDDLHVLIRQLKTELTWAMRTGIEPAPPPPPPDVEPFASADLEQTAEPELPAPPWNMGTEDELPPEAALRRAAVKPSPKREARPNAPWEAYTDGPLDRDGPPPRSAPRRASPPDRSAPTRRPGPQDGPPPGWDEPGPPPGYNNPPRSNDRGRGGSGRPEGGPPSGWDEPRGRGSASRGGPPPGWDEPRGRGSQDGPPPGWDEPRGSRSGPRGQDDRPPRGRSAPDRPASRHGHAPAGWAPGGDWGPVETNARGKSSRMPVLQQELDACTDLKGVREVLGDCDRCKLCSLGRKKIVFGVGNAQADIMFVGEGPGGDEDRIGEPFVGKAGQLLTRIIENGMKLRREEVYIANIVKCRPPRNRDPEPDEVEACEPFLKAQIRLVRPKVLVSLGRHASQTLLRNKTPISRLRGKWNEYDGIPLMPTFHPAYLLRNPAEKRPVWEDIQEVMRRIGLPVSGQGGRS